MPLTPGSLSQVAVSDVSDSLLSSAAVSGTTPYAYQWYRATSSAGFVPAASLAVSGATSLALSDSGLTPGTVYYYKVVAIDSAATPATVSTSALTVTTLQQIQSQNALAPSAQLGMMDLKLNFNTIPMQFDPVLGTGTAVAGQAVKFTTTAGAGAPKVVPCTAAADDLCGFINYNIKDRSFAPGDAMEVSVDGNVMFLWAALAINRGSFVTSLPGGVAGGCNGGVVPATGSSALPIAGTALDTVAIGQLCRVYIQALSGKLDS